MSEHPYKDAASPDDTFEVYQTDEGWFWRFCIVWRDAGPFATKELAIHAGENCLDENGESYFK